MSSNTENNSSETTGSTRNIDSFEERFNCLIDKGIDFDCTFIVGSENKTFVGHKLLFSTASEVFKDMFYGDFKDEDTIKIEDLNAEGFEGMKQFIYADGKVDFKTTTHALHTFIAARKYIIEDLVEKCKQFITVNLKPKDVIGFHKLCKTSNVSEFDNLCFKIIQKNTDKIVNSDEFLTARLETIELFLQSPVLELESELDVFHHFQKWAVSEAKRQGYSVDELETNFNNLKKYIRFLTIDADLFELKICESLLLTEEEKRAIISNQRKSDSIPMPKYLSSERQLREFSASKSINYHYDFEFNIPIDYLSIDTYFLGDVPYRIDDIEFICKSKPNYLDFYVTRLRRPFKTGLLQEIRYIVKIPTVEDGILELEGKIKLSEIASSNPKLLLFARFEKEDFADLTFEGEGEKVKFSFSCDLKREKV